MRHLASLPVLLLALVGACAEANAPGDGVPEDGGRFRDGGAGVSFPDGGRDGGAAPDAGARRDGGVPADAGDVPDGGVPADAGDAPDAGACPEGGCEEVTVMGVTLPACCPLDGDGCGYDLRTAAPLLELVAAEVSCVETGQPGAADATCPDLELLSGFLTLDGCCRPSGACGYLADDGGLGLPELGCVPYALFDGAGAPGRCTP